MTFFDAFAVSVGVVIMGVYIANRWRDVTYVRSDVDNQEYLVQKSDDSLEAANMLARLNDKVQRLIERLMARYPDDERVKRLDDRYNPNALSEGSHESGYTSYSVNKGQRIVMCLRARGKTKKREGPGVIEDENTLMYVLLHELTHLATVDVGHTPKFWENFRFIIKEAVGLGIYTDRDYSASPVNYCGIKIDSSSVIRGE